MKGLFGMFLISVTEYKISKKSNKVHQKNSLNSKSSTEIKLKKQGKFFFKRNKHISRKALIFLDFKISNSAQNMSSVIRILIVVSQ